MTRWLTEDEQRSWRAWLAASLLLQDRLNRDLQEQTGMTMADYEILVRLSEAPDRRIRMSELAELTLSSRSRLSHQIDRMESHPDEFFDGGGRWAFMYKEYYRDVLTEYEKAMLHTALKDLRRNELNAKVMEVLMKDQVKDRAFGRAMPIREGQAVSYDEQPHDPWCNRK